MASIVGSGGVEFAPPSCAAQGRLRVRMNSKGKWVTCLGRFGRGRLPFGSHSALPGWPLALKTRCADGRKHDESRNGPGYLDRIGGSLSRYSRVVGSIAACEGRRRGRARKSGQRFAASGKKS